MPQNASNGTDSSSGSITPTESTFVGSRQSSFRSSRPHQNDNERDPLAEIDQLRSDLQALSRVVIASVKASSQQKNTNRDPFVEIDRLQKELQSLSNAFTKFLKLSNTNMDLLLETMPKINENFADAKTPEKRETKTAESSKAKNDESSAAKKSDAKKTT